MSRENFGGEGMSVLKMEKGETSVYEWTFQIPPRSTLVENFQLFPTKASHHFSNLKFTTGFLSQVDHCLRFSIFHNLILLIKLDIKNTPEFGFLIGPCEVQALEGAINRGTTPFKPSFIPTIGGWQGFVKIHESTWDDKVDALKLVLNIRREILGTCINLSSEGPSPGPNYVFSQFVLSNFLSDVTLMCGKDKFAAHRIVLSGRSSVFKRMFENPMKETEEGLVVIDDIEPKVVEELLYFIYTGKFSSLNIDGNMYIDLLKSGEKYNVEELKLKCARKIEETLTTENAVEICVLADTDNEPNLMHKAIEIVKKDKTNALKDPKTAHELAMRCPKLVYELMLMN